MTHLPVRILLSAAILLFCLPDLLLDCAANEEPSIIGQRFLTGTGNPAIRIGPIFGPRPATTGDNLAFAVSLVSDLVDRSNKLASSFRNRPSELLMHVMASANHPTDASTASQSFRCGLLLQKWGLDIEICQSPDRIRELWAFALCQQSAFHLMFAFGVLVELVVRASA
jgi:hypothetical protein